MKSISVVFLINHLIVCVLACEMVRHKFHIAHATDIDDPTEWWLYILAAGCIANIIHGGVKWNLEYKLRNKLENSEKRIYELNQELSDLEEST